MYARHRFPAEIISYAVWLDFAFPLSYRDVQKLLLERGIEGSCVSKAWDKQQYLAETKVLRLSLRVELR